MSEEIANVEKSETIPNENDQKHAMNKYKSKFTMNKFGKMALTESPLFTTAKHLMSKSKPILDVAVAYGFTSRVLLENGFTVFANDLDERHLNNLEKSIDNEELKRRLTLKPGNILDLDFDEGAFSGIHAANLIHFLNGQQIRHLFHKFYRWLDEKGILVVTGGSPYHMIKFNPENAKPFIKKYYDYLNNRKVEWPGECQVNEINNDEIWRKHCSGYFNFTSSEILAREAMIAGFNIVKIEYYTDDTDGFKQIVELKDRTSVGIICVKETFDN